MERLPLVTSLSLLLLALWAPHLLVAQDASSQQPEFGITFGITGISHDDSRRELRSEAQKAMHAALLARGAKRAEHPNWTFVVAAQEVEQHDDLVVLSVAILAALPEPVVQWATESQIFYASMSNERREELPSEGKHIREYVSEEYIRGYGMLQEHEVLVVDRAGIGEGVAQIVEAFYERHTRD